MRIYEPTAKDMERTPISPRHGFAVSHQTSPTTMGDTMAVTGSTDMERQIKELQEQVQTARGYQRLLKANLASLNATSTSDDVRANVTALELEKEALGLQLEGFRTGRIRPVAAEEKERVDQTLQEWTRKADSRKHIFMELWAIVRDVIPAGQTKGQLWVGITSLLCFPTYTDLSMARRNLGWRGTVVTERVEMCEGLMNELSGDLIYVMIRTTVDEQSFTRAKNTLRYLHARRDSSSP